MTDYLAPAALWMLAQAGAAGAALGALYFGGLWLTVHRLLRSQRSALWLLGSFLLRSGTALGGFYWFAGDSWQRLLACLLGFILARTLLTRLSAYRDQGRAPTLHREEASHAP